jgi:chromosome segregation ATPase
VSPAPHQLKRKKKARQTDQSDQSEDETMAPLPPVKITDVEHKRLLRVERERDTMRRANEVLHKDIEALHKNADVLHKEKAGLKEDNDKYHKANDEAAAESLASIKTINDLTKEIDELTGEKEELEETLVDAYKALKDAGNHCKKEQKKAIKNKIQSWIKEVGFCTVKFVKEDKLDEFVDLVYKSIKDELKLTVAGTDNYCSKECFVRIYKAFIASELGDRRAYTQTGCFKACKGELFLFSFDNIWCILRLIFLLCDFSLVAV